MFDPSYKSSYNNHLFFPSAPTDHADSGVCSPTLWRTSPLMSSPGHRPEDYWSLSPDSKAEAIARGQRELMDMVSKMPESCYELSLRDLVELSGNEENERKVFDEMPERIISKSKVVKKVKSDKWIVQKKSESLLKILFPISLDSKKKTKKKKKKKGDSSVTSKSSQVSPRPSLSGEFMKGEDRDWWNDRSPELQGRTSKVAGSNRNSNNRNRSRNSLRTGKMGCFSFLWSLRS